MRNKARVEGCITEASACKEITNFSSMYFSRVNNVNAHILKQLVHMRENGKDFGATSAHFVIDKYGISHTIF
jgi:hypothetical protein